MKFETTTFRFEDLTLNFDKQRIPLSSGQREKRQGQYRYYGAQGVIDYVDDYIFDGKYLLIAEDGENLKSKKQDIAQIVKGKFWVNNHAHVVQGNALCLTEYLCYLLNHNDLSGYITGSAQPKLSQANLNAIAFDVPSIETQQIIVSIISALDEKIATNRAINDNLLAQAQALFTQRFMTDDIEGNEKPLYDFADYINGAAFKPSECGEHGLPIIKIVELKNGITDSTKYFDGFKGEKYLIQDKDILFSWSGNPDTSIDIFIWTHGSAILNQHTFNVKSNTGHRWFTFLMLKHFKPEFSRIASNKQTTGLGHVTANDLKRLTFIFNETAIETFEQEISPFMETIYSNMIEKQRLELLRDSLLPKLMSGEIDVSDIQL